MVSMIRDWLRVGELDKMVAQADNYPKLSGVEQAKGLRTEFRAFVRDVVFEGAGTLPALLTSNSVPMNPGDCRSIWPRHHDRQGPARRDTTAWSPKSRQCDGGSCC